MLSSLTNILIVDDMASLCELEKKLLSELGYLNVAAVNDVASAKQMLLSSHSLPTAIGLVLADINMPGESGIDLLRWIRSRSEFASLPVVMVSSMGDLENVMSAAELNASAFIVKPLKLEDLRAKLAKL